MRLAVSDYDGTLCIGGVVADSVLEAVREWRGRGNLFGIATGRDLGMITHETDRWGVEFDFLVCCNGAVLYDADLSVLQSLDIKAEVIPLILDHEADASVIYAVCGDQELYFCELFLTEWFRNLRVPYTPVTQEEARGIGKAQQISLAYRSVEESERRAAVLNKEFGRDIVAFQNNIHIDVVSADASKARGVEDMLRLKGLNVSEVLAVGDGENDLPMLERFRGFSVEGASPAVKRAVEKVYGDVGELLRDFM